TSYSYNANGFLTNVTDPASKDVLDVTYAASKFGKVAVIDRPSGVAAYRYAPASCTTGTEMLLGNPVDATGTSTAGSSGTDSGCTSANPYCSTTLNKCFQSKHCYTWNTSTGEVLITDDALSPSSLAPVTHFEYDTSARLLGINQNMDA